MLPGGFYLALALRWLRLGGRSPAAQLPLTDPDPVYQQAFREEILAAIVQHYFRGELHHLDHLPDSNAIIIAMNHAGMCFPWDFVGLALLLSQHKGWYVQPLAHPLFFDHPWLRWWLPSGWAQSLGGVRAEAQHFEAAIAQQAVLLYAPEGWRGLAKGWQHRYQLTQFDPSFVRLSIRYQMPILPVACLGSEALHPFTFNIKPLARWLKLPMFPLSPLMLAFILFPSMGVWAMRSRLRYYLQPLWRPWEQPQFEVATPPAIPKRAIMMRLAEDLRSRLQMAICELRQPRISKPTATQGQEAEAPTVPGS